MKKDQGQDEGAKDLTVTDVSGEQAEKIPGHERAPSTKKKETTEPSATPPQSSNKTVSDQPGGEVSLMGPKPNPSSLLSQPRCANREDLLLRVGLDDLFSGLERGRFDLKAKDSWDRIHPKSLKEKDGCKHIKTPEKGLAKWWPLAAEQFRLFAVICFWLIFGEGVLLQTLEVMMDGRSEETW